MASISGSERDRPARRDLLTGNIGFMETPWSPMMPWDHDVCAALRSRKRVYSHMITDHYHHFHSGCEAYHTRFDSWEFERGQEGDVWRPLVKQPPVKSTRGSLSHGRPMPNSIRNTMTRKASRTSGNDMPAF